ncbi:FAD-dependent monooxygenase [Chelativorans sp. YIM 93263]|uniref:FAD-dependent monooxygenase n=1 Tax=Chelativorans sp. YIM 93263 TaxID=2906648 RepID=UPI002377F34A|nr:FAD-dependent monooxygenase [Chelativorans sp. YIM 93263]
MTERSVIIAGAGIAGLTAALSFAAEGFSVTIFERAERLDEAGAGLQISPNATRILRRLGVLEPLAADAIQPSSIALRRAADLADLAQVPLGKEAERRWGAPYLVAHRADLQRALLDAVRAIPAIRLHLDAEVNRISFADGQAHVTVKQSEKLHKAESKLVIGSDGVWSKLRLLAGGNHSRFSGHIAFRTVLDTERLPRSHRGLVLSSDVVSALLAPDFHIVAYPLRNAREINLVAVTKGADMEARWANEMDTGQLTTALQRTAPELARAIHTADWRAWPIHTASARDRWTYAGRLALIGDAAHAMTPYAAQGAAMAIEDAALLAGLAGQSNDIPAALEKFEHLRRPRIARVARRASFNHFVWHARGPVALARDLVLRRREGADLAADLDWLYAYDVDNEIAAQSENCAAI